MKQDELVAKNKKLEMMVKINSYLMKQGVSDGEEQGVSDGDNISFLDKYTDSTLIQILKEKRNKTSIKNI